MLWAKATLEGSQSTESNHLRERGREIEESTLQPGLRSKPVPVDGLVSAASEDEVPIREPGEGGQLRYASPEAIFRGHYVSLSQALAIVAGDKAVAEEAVQEAFSRLCLHWDRISEYEDQVAWVRRVAVNQIKDEQRALRRRATLWLKMAKRPKAVLHPEPTDAHLWRAVRRLPLKQRTALALYYVADLSVADVAAAMGISVGAVLKHLDRARSRLRRLLEASHE